MCAALFRIQHLIDIIALVVNQALVALH